GFSTPNGIAPAPGNNLYVVDEPGGVAGQDPGGIWKIDLTTGLQTPLTHGGYLVHPQDIGIDASGNLIVDDCTSVADALGAVIKYNPYTNVQSVITQDGVPYPLYYLNSLAVDPTTGTIYAGAISDGFTSAAVFTIDPVTGMDQYLTQGDSLSLV